MKLILLLSVGVYAFLLISVHLYFFNDIDVLMNTRLYC